ncbi:MAG: hypothetical protein ACRDQX_06870 [Pseudonocardiaceae bacterium]
MNPNFSALSRVGAASCLAASGVIHAQLYVPGYRVIPGVGPAFLRQASGSLTVTRLAAAGLAAGALGGFVPSRTIGIFGFIEYGRQPAPRAVISVIVELTTLRLLATELLASRDAVRSVRVS